MNITEKQKQQLIDLNDSRVNEILNIKPSLNKWYKVLDSNYMIYLTKYVDLDNCEGFYFAGSNGEYMGFCDDLGFHGCTLATEQEVGQVLTDEAKKRGFKQGVKFKCLITNEIGEMIEDYLLMNGCFGGDNSLESAFKNDIINGVLFKDGVWAEIIDDKTELKQEIKELRREIMKFEELEEKVINWGAEKGILDKATPLAQCNKTFEEVEELKEVLEAQEQGLETFINSKGFLVNTNAEIKDAFGDIVVTVILGCKLQGLDFTDCLESAYNVISKRTGKMVNGQFVKDGH